MTGDDLVEVEVDHMNEYEEENVEGEQELTIADLSGLVQGKNLRQLVSYGGAKKLAKKLGSNPQNGFNSSFNFQRQRDLYGRNYVPPPRPQLYIELIIDALKDTTIIMLIGAATLSLVLGLAVEKDLANGWIEGVSILVAVLVVINVQAGTDYTKAKEFRRQQIELENQQISNLIRDGRNIQISPREIVVGDIVRFAVGDILPVDCILLEGSDVKMDESALTGETKLVAKTSFKADEYSLNAETKDQKKIDPFLVSGTNVMSGSGLALAVAVGENSVQGSILAAVGRDAKGDDGQTNDKPTGEATGKTSNVGKPVEIEIIKEDYKKEENTVSDNLEKTEVNGGNLVSKLDRFAILIGKFGFTIAIIALIIMLVKYGVVEFAQNDRCEKFATQITCENEGGLGSFDFNVCKFVASSSECRRFWNNKHDLHEILDFFVTAITILVVVIPEGLPLAVTLALAVSMRRMMKDNNQVKYLDACETMGSATTICSDKTGTLTLNKMTVVGSSLGHGIDVDVLKIQDAVKQGSQENTSGVQGENIGKVLNLICYNSILNSASTSNVLDKNRASPNPAEWFSYQGNATECALLKFAILLGFDPIDIRRSEMFKDPNSELSDWGSLLFPFSSEKKKMSIVVPLKDTIQDEDISQYRMFLKGAPVGVLNSCSFVLNPNPSDISLSLHNRSVENEIVGEDELAPLDEETRNRILAKVTEFQREGLRVIAFAYKDIPKTDIDDWRNKDKTESEVEHMQKELEMESELVFLGIVGIEDPLRPEIIEAIKKCSNAGVDVRMCTGDALETAISIAVKAGILKPEHLQHGDINKPLEFFAMTGPEFVERVIKLDTTKPKVRRNVFDFETNSVVERLEYPFRTNRFGEKVIDQKKMDAIWPKLRVLARCQPQDKFILVTGLQNSNIFSNQTLCDELRADFNIEIFPDRQVVAVTGDGTNDAPALKKADVGFAMGITGTETAKQAADILLLDDNFHSIVKAVMWGRNVYEAISKFVQFQLTVNVVAVFVAVLGAIVENQSPLRPVQMLWVNLIMDSLASLALATDPPNEHLLERKPYGRKRRILSNVMLFNILGQAIYQISALLIIFFKPDLLPGTFEPNSQFENTELANEGYGSVHWSIFFNAFVLMQIFNEFNARKLQNVKRLRKFAWEWNVFENVFANHIFVVIIVVTFTFQILIVQYGGAFFTLSEGGLSVSQWIFCLLIGMTSLLWQIIFVNPIICLFATEDEAFVKESDLPIAERKRTSIISEGLFVRGENRADPSFQLTKQYSLKFSEMMKSQGKSLRGFGQEQKSEQLSL